MEEDIKILEEMVEKSRDLREEDFYKLIGIKQIQAIATFIKANKELEEKLDETLNANLALVQGNANSIPISLVEEKIEEYQNNMKLYENETHNIFNENNIRQEVITVLQELLEKR